MHKPANTYMFNTSPQLLPRLSPREIKDNAHRFETRVRNLNCPRCKTIFGVAQINVRDIFLLHVQTEFCKSFAIRESDFSESECLLRRFSALFFRVPQNPGSVYFQRGSVLLLKKIALWSFAYLRLRGNCYCHACPISQPAIFSSIIF